MQNLKKKEIINKYLNYFIEKENEWESLCINCGGCCGAFDDPCFHLKKNEKGMFYCEIYCNRFGLKKSISGDEFNCVMIKEILHTHWRNDHLCGYKKYLKSQGLNQRI
ncbi:MAG: hypothetical protein KAJ79_03460 [Candidatus Omnitrophica bacterium]|nr:hypothetical protein [Candidatus Omnitrophota bacterium]MCK5288095.1 hypothetical protein [Candidatus Omnitrophota bacterium]